jgi:hypothetical protein
MSQIAEIEGVRAAVAEGDLVLGEDHERRVPDDEVEEIVAEGLKKIAGPIPRSRRR